MQAIGLCRLLRSIRALWYNCWTCRVTSCVLVALPDIRLLLLRFWLNSNYLALKLLSLLQQAVLYCRVLYWLHLILFTDLCTARVKRKPIALAIRWWSWKPLLSAIAVGHIGRLGLQAVQSPWWSPKTLGTVR